MERDIVVNEVLLIGRVIGKPVFNHKAYGEAFYTMFLGIFRKSGYEDRIRIIMPEKILRGKSPREGEIIKIEGQIRTYNRELCGKSKLEVVVFVKTLEYKRKEAICFENKVVFEGYICKAPIKRTSPLGRDICDLMIAVNRMYNKSDYIPTIAWGRNADWCEGLSTGDKISVEGRIQSREYHKHIEDGSVITKTAYEVSAMRIERA